MIFAASRLMAVFELDGGLWIGGNREVCKRTCVVALARVTLIALRW
jgi:hypothetical protein